MLMNVFVAIAHTSLYFISAYKLLDIDLIH